jgi:type I restriction enzyme S subunit
MRVANVQDGHIDLTDIALLEVAVDDIDRYSLAVGDVLMNEGGDYDKLGRGAVWDGPISPCLHQNHVFAVRLEDVSWAPWVSALTRTAYAKFYFMNNSKQSTNLASISQSNVKEWPVVLPSKYVRDQLLGRLNDELTRVNYLISHVALELARLTELRSTTIAEAVLGRIDPRRHGTPTSAMEATA